MTLRFLILAAFLCSTSLFGAAATKVGGSGKTKVGGSGATKVQATVASGATVTYVQAGQAAADAGNPLAVTLTGVTLGNAIIVGVKFENSGAAITTVVDSGGTGSASTWVASAQKAHTTGGEPIARFVYTTANTMSGSVTYTATQTGAPSFMRMYVAEVSFTGGTFQIDQTDMTKEGSASGALVSNAITTTGTTEIVFGLFAGYTGITFTSPLVGGAAATFVNTGSNLSDAAMWYKVATLSSGTAGVNASASDRYILPIISFKVQ